MDFSIVTQSQLAAGIQNSSTEHWIVAAVPDKQHDSLMEINSPSLFILPSNDVHCSICTRDLCSKIYSCGNGIHMFCESCVSKSKTFVLNINDEDQNLVEHLMQTLHSSSPPMKRRRCEKTIGRGIFCEFCKSNGSLTRVKWLENAIQPFTQPCPHQECDERILPRFMQEHVQTCIWRPHKCFWCDHQFKTFDSTSFTEHVESMHNIQKLPSFRAQELSSSELNFDDSFHYIDLSSLKTPSDYGYVLYGGDMPQHKRKQVSILIITFSEQDSRGIKLYDIQAIDMTLRKTPDRMFRYIIKLYIRNIGQCEEEFRQYQTVELKFQQFEDEMQLENNLIALAPNSRLFGQQ